MIKMFICFKKDFSELDGILSPMYFAYKPKNTSKFIELEKLAKVNPERKLSGINDDEEVPYVGLPETDDHEIKEVLLRPYKEVKGRKIIKKGDILFARIEPSIFNKKYIYVDDLGDFEYALTSTEFYIVEPKDNIIAKFLFYMFFSEPVYFQVKGKTTGSTGRRRLDKKVFENLLIPNPSKETQEKIVKLMEKAHKGKKHKMNESKSVLKSIDKLLQQELEIKDDNIKENITFPVFSKEIKDRIDPYYYNPKFSKILNLLAKKYPTVPLGKGKGKDKLADIFSGKTPAKKDYSAEGNLILKAANLKNNKINWKTKSFVDKDIKLKDTIKDNDILLLSSAHQADYLGKNPCIVNIPKELSNTKIYFVGELIVIRSKNINPYYLLGILKLEQYYLLLNREKRGQSSHLYSNDLKNIEIPIPPDELQDKIADEIRLKMNEAEELELNSRILVKNAEKDVEKILLDYINKEGDNK